MIEVGNVFYMEDKETKAIVRELFSNQSCIIDGQNERIKFTKLVENEELKQGKVRVIDWSLFF
jgi:hypothetical protein